MIYAVWAEGTPYIKIGWVDRPSWLKKRVQILQVGCPFELQLIAQIEGTLDEEQAIHLMLQDSLERGEWFRLGTSVRQVLAQMADGREIKAWDLTKAASTRMRRMLWWTQNGQASVREIRLHHNNKMLRWKQQRRAHEQPDNPV